MIRAEQAPTLICPRCHHRFEQAEMDAALEALQRPCAVCGEPFIGRTRRAIYCSAACSQKAYRRRKREERLAGAYGR